MTDWFREEGSGGLAGCLESTRVLFRQKSAFQEIEVFENPSFGRVLALDGIVQATEHDEFIYHEMLVHVPLLALDEPVRVLLIGGGDGGALRELFKHPIRQVTMIELDPEVVRASREHLPSLSAGAFDDPRLDLRFGDGVAFAAESDQRFDVIIVDSTDPYPQGPGQALFSTPFYQDCRRLLAEPGVLISQCGTPFIYPEPFRQALERLEQVFEDTAAYLTAVPSFAGGYTVYAWASPDPSLRRASREALQARLSSRGLAPRFYSPEFHRAAFASPRTLVLPGASERQDRDQN